MTGFVVELEKATLENNNYRKVLYTSKRSQLVLMTIQPGDDIGLETHAEHDQFIRVEEGNARVVMGATKNKMTFDKKVSADWAILIPSGYWHNIINIGDKPLKVYVLYAPPEHPAGTIDKTFKH